MIILTLIILLFFSERVQSRTGIKEYTLKYLIQENEPIGRMVGTIVTDIEGSAFILTMHGPLTFKLSGPNCCFRIDQKSSVLSIEKNIDLESICRNRDLSSDCSSGQGNLELIVNLWSSMQLLAVVRVRISVLDVNDNIPQFTKDKIEKHVSEASHKTGSSIYLEMATDADIAPENARIEYGLSEHSSTFQLRVDQLRQPYLLLLKDLDAETQTRYQIKIRAWNAQDNKLWNEVNVDLLVDDFNDNPPKFNASTFSVMVKENTPAKTMIFQLTAIDPDSSSSLRFDLYQTANRELRKLFSVLENGTVILISSWLDYERNQRYHVPVRVTDGLYDARAVLEILVEDENDEKPQLIQNPSVIEVTENSGKGLIIGQVIVTDKDGSHTNGKIICNHETVEVGLGFSLNSAKNNKDLIYDIQTKMSFDREKTSHVSVVLVCSDGWNTTTNNHLTSSFTINVEILDINDNHPTFRQSQYTIHIMENSPVGTTVIEVNADDLDDGLNGKIIYSLENDFSMFQIDSSTGLITVQGVLDREYKEQYKVSVRAMDRGTVPLNSSATLFIIVDDVNDNTPCLLSPFEFSVYENAGPISIGQLRHEDSDSGANSEVTYSKLWPGDDTIMISENGTLFSTKSLDRETKDRHCLRVRLRDNGLTGRRQSSGEVCIRVIDVNDNKPRLINPRGLRETDDATTPVLSQSISISIYESPGYTITQLMAVDNDESINAKITYHIKLPENLPFSILDLNSSSGQIILAKSISSKFIGQYSIKVLATDSGSPPLTDEKIFQLTITNKPSKQDEKSKGINENSWVDKNSLLVVIILSCISLSFIAMLVTAIICMLRPCYQRNNVRYNKDWVKKISSGRAGSLKTIGMHDTNSGSLQENLLINGNADISSSFLSSCIETSIDLKPYSNLENQVYADNEQTAYMTNSTMQRCHGSRMMTGRHTLSRLDYGMCSQCPIMSNYGTQAYATFGHFIDTSNDDEIKEDFQSDSGRGASEDDTSRTNGIRLKLAGQVTTFKENSIDNEKMNIPMATLSGRIDSNSGGGGSGSGSGSNICPQISTTNNYMKPDVLCDEINQLFFHNLIKS